MKSSVTAFAIMMLQVVPIHVNAREPWHFVSDTVLIGYGTSNRCNGGTFRLMIANIRLMGQSKSIRSIIVATQQEQRYVLA